MEAGTFAIVETVVPAERRGRLRRVPAYVLGLVFVALGVVGWLPLVFFLLSTAYDIRAGQLDLADDADAWLWVAGIAVVAYVVVRVGVRLMRGPRRSVLFLRRFGFTDATRVLTDAVVRGLGRRWRLITLDDLQVVPVGTGRRSWIVRAGPPAVIAGIFAVVLAVLPGYLDEEARQAAEEAKADAQANNEGCVGELFAQVFASAITAVLVLLVVLTPLAILGAIALFGIGAGAAARRAEGRRAVHIERERQVKRRVREVEQATSRIYSPRLTVVRCANEVWQAVVRRFAAISDATLIDVSEASPGLLWELTELGPTEAASWVLVGRHDRLVGLLTDGTPAAVQLRTMLAGHTVLAYRLDDPVAFQQALHDRLTHVP